LQFQLQQQDKKQNFRETFYIDSNIKKFLVNKMIKEETQNASTAAKLLSQTNGI